MSGAKDKIDVVLFGGGTGTHSITEAFLKQPRLSLTILINAYDDGHSTGRLRKFIPGMLGPSDVRKNIDRLMPRAERCHQALKKLSSRRLPMDLGFDRGLDILRTLADGTCTGLDPATRALHEQCTVKQAAGFRAYCAAFERYVVEQRHRGVLFDFHDCAIGNILFAGCFLLEGRDFNRAVDAFSAYYEAGARLLNVTQGENLFLVATREDGTLLPGEADIVSAQNNRARIQELYLLDETAYRGRIENAPAPPPEKLAAILAGAVTPEINPEAEAAIRRADVIIYGPGTQHSSLFPSYLTRGVGEAVAANQGADKIFIANIRRDHDIQRDNANDLAIKLLASMSRNGAVPLEWKDVVTHFFFQHGDVEGEGYVPFEPKKFHFPLELVKLRDWEFQEGKHAGGYVLAELQQIVQSRIQIAIPAPRHLVSIVVPALDEAATVEEVLKGLTALDFEEYGLGKEILLVDGGSTDGTPEKARAVRGVRVFSIPRKGRGAALRLGIAQARGDIVVFFPSDNEYRPRDVEAVVGAIARQGFKAVYGTRALKCADLDGRLKRIYGDSALLYRMSKYGGMLLSALMLVFFNRYITDTLTTLKGFDGKLLRSLDLKGDGLDLEMEILAKISRRHEYVLEVPVEYRPRTRAEGKKTTVFDGLHAAAALLKYRWAR